MDPLLVEFKALLGEFAQAMNAAGAVGRPAVLGAYQRRFGAWADKAQAENASGLSGAIALARDIEDQSIRHADSLMDRVNAAMSRPGAPAASSFGSAGILVVIVLLFLAFK